MSERTPPEAPAVTPLEALLVITLCFGLFIANSVAAVAAGFPTERTFSDASFTSLIVSELAMGGLALLLLRLRGHSLASLLPVPSWGGCFAGIALYVAAMLAWSVTARLFTAQQLGEQPIADMAAHATVSLPVVMAVAFVNGIYEETFLVGYLVRGLAGMGASTAIGVSALVRLLYHLYQGPIGAVSVLVFGLLVSVFYWRTRSLWPVAFAHVLADASAFS